MANHAFASFWCREFSEETMLERFGQFLSTVPFSASQPGFTQLAIRAVDSAEPFVAEYDLRALPIEAAEAVELAREHVHGDSAFETQTFWDLWTYDLATDRWHQSPHPIEIFCFGEEYDDGAWRESGHLQAGIGFEHLFTGHAGLLGMHRPPTASPQHPAEQAFFDAMAKPENLRSYHEKTGENIRKLHNWVSQVEAAVPIERFRLWSEGEENFEARLDEILAVR